MVALAIAVGCWALRDLAVGPSVNEDGVRDLLTAARAASFQGFPAFGPGIHGTAYGFLGPLYYLFLALPLGVHPSVGVVCAWVFAAHVGMTLAVARLAWAVDRGGAWLAVLALLAVGRYTVAFDLEHESFVLAPVALSAYAALRHARGGPRACLAWAFFWAAVAVQFQSLAVLVLLPLAGLRWRSGRAAQGVDVAAALLAWTAPFALTLLAAPGMGHPAYPRGLPWILHQSLVPLTSLGVVAIALGRQAASSRNILALALVLAASLAPPLAARDQPSTLDGGVALRYFTFELPVVSAQPHKDNPEHTGLLAWAPVIVVALLLASLSRTTLFREPRLRSTLRIGLALGAAPGALLYVLHPCARFLAPFVLWPIVAVGALGAALIAMRGRAGVVPAVLLGGALAWFGLRPTLGVDSYNPLSVRRPLGLDSRSALALSARLGVRPAALVGRLHGLDGCGRPYAGFSLPSRVVAAFDVMRRGADDPTDVHYVMDGIAHRTLRDCYGGAPRAYRPALRYDTARVEGVPVARLPVLAGQCAFVIPPIASPPFDARGGCAVPAGPVRVTIAHDGRARDGRIPLVDVLVEDADSGRSSTPSDRGRAGCAVTLTQDGASRHGVVRRPGGTSIVRFALAPQAGSTTLVVTASCPLLRTLDVWDAAP